MAPSKPKMPPLGCQYPESNALSLPIQQVLANVLAKSVSAGSFYLDTTQSMDGGTVRNMENHAQGLARTHQLSKGDIYWFLAYSEIGAQATVSIYQYSAPTANEHVFPVPKGHSLSVAPMQQMIHIAGEQHPSDIAFLPDVNHADSGYLFVTEEYGLHAVAVYYWQLGNPLRYLKSIVGFPTSDHASGLTGPQFVFIDKVGGTYFLGAASSNWGWGLLFRAEAEALFGDCQQGGMSVDAFELVSASEIASFPPAHYPPALLVPSSVPGVFYFPVTGGPSQVKLVKDSTGAWFLLAFRSDPNDSTQGTDYVDVYPVQFEPTFKISDRLFSQHVVFPPGDTSFASTGTHYVNKEGTIMISTSYRWAKDDLSGGAGYVTRVDECTS
jgi:hypothetical protein